MWIEPDTELHGTPGCLHHRWVVLFHGESAQTDSSSLLLSQRFSRIFESHNMAVFLCRRFLLPEYLPYAGIFHERGQPGLATHSSVNRVLAGKQGCQRISSAALSQTDFNPQSDHRRLDCFPFENDCCSSQALLLVMGSLQLPATSQTPPTVCSGGTSPSLTCLRSATVNKHHLFMLHSGLSITATRPPLSPSLPPPPAAMC